MESPRSNENGVGESSKKLGCETVVVKALGSSPRYRDRMAVVIQLLGVYFLVADLAPPSFFLPLETN